MKATKRLGTMPGYIYWSDLEFAKCGALGDEYCIALLLPMLDDYAIAWIWRPVVELASAERYVDWIWDGRRSDQLPDGDWQPVSPPSLQPRFTYRVLLTQEYVNALPKDASDLDLLKRRVAVQQTTDRKQQRRERSTWRDPRSTIRLAAQADACSTIAALCCTDVVSKFLSEARKVVPNCRKCLSCSD